MKTFLFILALFPTIIYGQSVLPLRADTVRIEKVGGSGELQVRNASRGVLGILTNVGGGATRFIKTNRVQDTLFIGRDTIIGARKVDTLYRDGDSIRFTIAGSPYAIEGGKTYTNGFGAGDGLVSGTTIKRLEAGYGIDHFVSSGNIKVSVDTNEVATPYDLTQLSTIHEPYRAILIIKDTVANSPPSSDTSNFNFDNETKTLYAAGIQSGDITVVRQDSSFVSAYRNKTLTFVGTSITAGIGVSTPDKRYSTQAANSLGGMEDNKGVSSSMLEKRSPTDAIPGGVNALDRMTGDIPTYNASTNGILVLEWLMNDYGYTGANYTTANATTDYQTYLTYIKTTAGWPGNKILILSPGYVSDASFTFYSLITGLSAPTRQRMLDFVAVAKNTARANGTMYLDMYHYMLSNGGSLLLNTDGVHPNERGAKVMARGIVNRLGGHFVDDGAVTTNIMHVYDRINIGENTSGSVTTPPYVSFGNSFGTPLKIRLYEDGTSNNDFGFGVSSGNLNYRAGGSGSNHTFDINGTGPYLQVTNTGLKVTTYPAISLGSHSMSSTSTPAFIDAGGTYVSNPLDAAQQKLYVYNNGSGGIGAFTMGASALYMNVSGGLNINFGINGADVGAWRADGRFQINTSTNTHRQKLFVNGTSFLYDTLFIKPPPDGSVGDSVLVYHSSDSTVRKISVQSLLQADGWYSYQDVITGAGPTIITPATPGGRAVVLEVTVTAEISDGSKGYTGKLVRGFHKTPAGICTGGTVDTQINDGFAGSTFTATLIVSGNNPAISINGVIGETYAFTVKYRYTNADYTP